MKSLIAFSSIGHMSLVLGGVLRMFMIGWVRGVCLMFAHGLCSPCIFSLANFTYSFFNTRSMMVCKGILKIFPGLRFLWFIVAVLNIGCPPSLNFLREVFLVIRIFFVGSGLVVPLGLMCFIRASYCLYLYCGVNHGGIVGVEFRSVQLRSRRLGVVFFSCLLLFFLFLLLDFRFV